MGGGNGQKSATARARNEKKRAQGHKGSQLAVNAAACNIVCQVCRQSFMNVSNDAMLMTHATNKHAGKKTPKDCFPGRF
ncbi:unnamed protein product [Discosporangium mesarthrocarpum]